MVKYVDKNGLIYYTSKIKGIRDDLQNQIDDIKSIGRFLSNWSCKTGKPTSEPPGLSPGDAFTYRSGDYYLVSEIAASGGTNYRPNGSTYIVGSTSSTVETDEVAVGDMYIYDSQNWLLLYNTRKTVSFSNLSGSPYDNTNLSSALNSKQNELLEGTGIAIDADTNTISNSGVRGVSTGSTNGTISVNTNGTSAEVPVAGLGSAAYTPSTNYATSAQGTKADTALQDVQVNGTSVVSGTTANIPKASNSTLGVVQTNGSYGIEISANGYIATIPAAEATLVAKLNGRNVVVANNLDIAIREGLGNNSLTWTDAYKTSARNTIGAGAKTIIREWVG